MIPPTFSLFYNNPYLKDMQAYDAIPPPQAIIALPAVLPLSSVLSLPPMFYSRDFFPPEKISPPKDTETPVKSPISVSPSSSVGSSSPVRSTTSPPDYPFDKSIFAELDNSLWIIPRPLGEEPVLEESNELDACQKMPPKKTSTSETPAITLAAIQQLIADGIAAALEAQAATMASASNPNRNTGPTGTPVFDGATHLSYFGAFAIQEKLPAKVNEARDTVMSSDSASSEEPDSPKAAPASPDYVHGPEEPEQAPLSPDYVPGPEYPEYLASPDKEVPIEDQPYVVADSPIALSPG
ncbi:hypothetical protein Tco_0255461 [Tanacetum coccineum]